MTQGITVARLDDLPPGSMLAVTVEGESVLLANCAGTIYATNNICSHQYAELHEGYLDCDSCQVECPLHGAAFDLGSGAARSLPATAPITTYAVIIEDGMIIIPA